MYRKEFINAISEKSGLDARDADKAVRAFTEAVTEALSEGGRVTMMGFGTFSVQHLSQRIGRNPQTGEPLVIPPRNIPRFRPGKHFREAVEEELRPVKNRVVYLAAAALALAVAAVLLFMPGSGFKEVATAPAPQKEIVAPVQPAPIVAAGPDPEEQPAVEEPQKAAPEVITPAPDVLSVAEIVAALPVVDDYQFASAIGSGDRYYITVNFDYNSDHINRKPIERLYQVFEAIRPHMDDVREIRIEGHTDAVGPDPYNADLSQRRALAVADMITGELGDQPVDVVVQWQGENDPLVSNATPSGRAKNRRVEVMVRFERSAMAFLD